MTIPVVARVIDGMVRAYSPPGDGPFPALLLLHGSEGGWSGWSHRNAVLLASAGFLAYPFSYSYSGSMWFAGDIIDVPLDATEAAMAKLRDHPLSSGKLGLYGISRGAEHALLVTALMARDGVDGIPDAVAAHSPCDVVCGAFRPDEFRSRTDPNFEPWDPALIAWTWRGSTEGLRPSDPIEIERYDGPLKISHGTDDKVWTVECTRRIERRLSEARRSADITYHEGEGHWFSPAEENIHIDQICKFFETALA